MDEIDEKSCKPTGRKSEYHIDFVLKTKNFDFWNKEDVDKYGYAVG